MAEKLATVEDYLNSLPPGTRAAFEQARTAIRRVLPGATEAVSYQILAFQVDGRTVVHLAGWKQHLSIYPMPDLDPDQDGDLADRVAAYRSGQSTAKFPLSQPIPEDLIGALVERLAARP
jgi:uncharacterized protein YdhG (YjbR/CyaY superfamily)